LEQTPLAISKVVTCAKENTLSCLQHWVAKAALLSTTVATVKKNQKTANSNLSQNTGIKSDKPGCIQAW
jgi:hypothetical protein